MASTSLPVSTDVMVNITVPIAATATNMSVGCILTQDSKPASWAPSQILGFYATAAALATDFGPSTAVYNAGQTFFAQSPRPAQMAVGLVTGAVLETTLVGGSFAFSGQPTAGDTITIGAQTYRFESTMAKIGDVKLDSTLALTLGHLVATINGTGVAGTDFFAGTPSLATIVTATETGANTVCTLTYVLGNSGAPVLSKLSTASEITVTQGDPSITSYAAAVQAAATAGGSYLFGWALSNTMRVVAEQQALAAWCLANQLAPFLSTNDTANAQNATVSTDIGSLLKLASNTSACVFYHDFASEYPEVAALALMLSTDYSGVNTTRTLKFTALANVSASSISQTAYNVLNGKNYNMVSLTGNQVVITREGKNSATSWWTDQYAGIQNFANEIQYAVFNVFLAKNKVPYTVAGQMMLKQACVQI
jgi:hypothetical protein